MTLSLQKQSLFHPFLCFHSIFFWATSWFSHVNQIKSTPWKNSEKIHGIQVLSLVSCSGAELLWRHHSYGHQHHQGPPQVQRPWGSTKLDKSSTLIHRQSLASSPSPLITWKWLLDLGVCPRLVSADGERISPWWKNKWKSEAPFTSCMAPCPCGYFWPSESAAAVCHPRSDEPQAWLSSAARFWCSQWTGFLWMLQGHESLSQSQSAGRGQQSCSHSLENQGTAYLTSLHDQQTEKSANWIWHNPHVIQTPWLPSGYRHRRCTAQSRKSFLPRAVQLLCDSCGCCSSSILAWLYKL